MNRVWIYQANRFLTDEEVRFVETALADFVSSWTAHGSALAGTGSLRYNLFLVLEVNEQLAGVTGCSIDKSVHFLKKLGQDISVDFFDRMKVSFRGNNGEVMLTDREEFESLIKKGAVTADTIVFNNLIKDSFELATQWEIPFKESWHSKVF
ncbi:MULTISPECIES: ABC transporter ATPase [Sphingobacterium]|uniref:ABC transporter ATPase n=1 Tax=Sphingobacterium TaxID=28453 RepID=UPI0013D9C79D|nr:MULTISPECIES: ABC transporter ATPase [unclassified Sphingobacterium]